MHRELHGFALWAGLEVLGAWLEGEREEACGPRYRHLAGRRAYRSGHAQGELVMGGRRVGVRRPRARGVDGREVVLPSWRLFSEEDPLTERAFEQMVLGVAARRYRRSLEVLPEGMSSRGARRSAVSRRFVEASQAKLEELLSRPLEGLGLKVLMLDGLHFADHVVLVALGIDAGGRKHLLGLAEGATENAAACVSLLTGLRERGLETSGSLLVVTDGSKALSRAVCEIWGGRALVQRCQVHKKRNVLDHLPQGMRPSVGATLRQAYGSRDAERARRLLVNLAKRLEGEHPGAAASLREGLEETLTVMGMGLAPALERTLSSTNVLENLLGAVRATSRRVKRWKEGGMILRWVAAGLTEAEKGFRRVRGYQGMAQLSLALAQKDERLNAEVKTVEAA